MKTIIVTMQSASPYSQSRPFVPDKQPGETHEDHDARRWRERIHVNDKQEVIIPPMAFKNAIAEAAKYLSIPVPGKGKATYTKYFEAGIIVPAPVEVGIPLEKVEMERLFVPASGKRGDGTRVWRHFPLIREWKGECQFTIIDEAVLQKYNGTDRSVFEFVLEQAGLIIGIGRFRPRNNGYYGRFVVADIKEAA